MTIFTRQPFKRRRGFSLIELLLVLGVIAILLVAAFVIYPRVRLANQVNSEVTNIAAIQANVRSMMAPTNGQYSLVGSDSVTTTATMNNARVFPAGMNSGNYEGSDIRNAWGGLVSVRATTVTHSTLLVGRGFSINYDDVPSDACVELITRAMKNFYAVQVAFGNTGNNIYPDRDTATVDLIVTRCNGAPTGTIRFIST